MSIKRILAIILVYGVTCFAWMALGGITYSRTHDQRDNLSQEVASLWGEPHTQKAPHVEFRPVVPAPREVSESVRITNDEATALKLEFPTPELPEKPTKPEHLWTEKEKKTYEDKLEIALQKWVIRGVAEAKPLEASTLNTKLGSDPRRKGLVWYALYDVWFSGDYVYKHEDQRSGYVDLSFDLPTSAAIYDGLVFQVNGEDRRDELNPGEGKFDLSVLVHPGDEIKFAVAYKSRGADNWRYDPGDGIRKLENFKMSMDTDFGSIDFPERTLSPTTKTPTKDGWALTWDFASTVTGHGMGMVMPSMIQPGELSTALTFSAPISLMFFFIMLFVVATLQKLEIHPVNYLFLSSAFFAFHLLFSYSADHMTVPWVFGISSAVSLFLVVSYLRLVVSPKFALREAALGQLVYLIGFSLAHFWEGYTGLTITILAILTLFLLMQATGRLRWADVLRSPPNQDPPPTPPTQDPPVIPEPVPAG